MKNVCFSMRLINSIFFLLAFTRLHAQTIELEFPKFAGKTYEFVIFQGDKSVKVYKNDTIPQNGVVKLVIPPPYAPYTGMCRWLITNTAEGGGLDMAIPGQGFKVKCFSAQPTNDNIVFEGYDAMHELNRLNTLQQAIIDKFETMSRAAKLYDSKHPLYASFLKEKEAQKLDFDKFQQDLAKNTNYNARVLPILNLVRGISPKLTDDYEQRAKYVNAYIVNELNYDHLYASGHWTGIIQSWVQMHAQLLGNKEGFAKDFQTIHKRMSDPDKYTDWVGKVTYYLTEFGKDDFIEAIAPMVVASGKITSYEGKTMQVYVKAMTGMQAPDLQITEHIGKIEDHQHKTTVLKSRELATGDYQHTLLVFYQSGCGPCEELLQKLPPQYSRLKAKGVRVISISADEQEQVFKNASALYPWADKYCDFEGRNGANFKNYAVAGTPTLLLINKQGTIMLRTSRLEEILTNFQI